MADEEDKNNQDDQDDDDDDDSYSVSGGLGSSFLGNFLEVSAGYNFELTLGLNSSILGILALEAFYGVELETFTGIQLELKSEEGAHSADVDDVTKISPLTSKTVEDEIINRLGEDISIVGDYVVIGGVSVNIKDKIASLVKAKVVKVTQEKIDTTTSSIGTSKEEVNEFIKNNIQTDISVESIKNKTGEYDTKRANIDLFLEKVSKYNDKMNTQKHNNETLLSEIKKDLNHKFTDDDIKKIQKEIDKVTKSKEIREALLEELENIKKIFFYEKEIVGKSDEELDAEIDADDEDFYASLEREEEDSGSDDEDEESSSDSGSDSSSSYSSSSGSYSSSDSSSSYSSSDSYSSSSDSSSSYSSSISNTEASEEDETPKQVKKKSLTHLYKKFYVKEAYDINKLTGFDTSEEEESDEEAAKAKIRKAIESLKTTKIEVAILKIHKLEELIKCQNSYKNKQHKEERKQEKKTKKRKERRKKKELKSIEFNNLNEATKEVMNLIERRGIGEHELATIYFDCFKDKKSKGNFNLLPKRFHSNIAKSGVVILVYMTIIANMIDKYEPRLNEMLAKAKAENVKLFPLKAEALALNENTTSNMWGLSRNFVNEKYKPKSWFTVEEIQEHKNVVKHMEYKLDTFGQYLEGFNKYHSKLGIVYNYLRGKLLAQEKLEDQVKKKTEEIKKLKEAKKKAKEQIRKEEYDLLVSTVKNVREIKLEKFTII